jgi:predicted phosphodiesterase
LATSRYPLSLQILLGVAFLALPCAAWSKDPAWLSLGANGQVLARTVVKAGCPQIAVDGKQTAMTARLAPGSRTPPAGQRLVCEANVSGAKTVRIAGKKLRMPSATPERIVVIGDTGCRIKVEAAGSGTADLDSEQGHGPPKVQDCNNGTLWPFKAIAAAAVKSKPDLVIHVGDYIYREAACPPDYSKDCGGSPWGDKWETWDADFFSPAEPLLAAAPWIFVRGNHEICARAGKGWFYYLDQDAYTQNDRCADDTPIRNVTIGGFQALVVDSSNAPDADPTPAQVENFTRQFEAASATRPTNAWFLSHRPIWAAKAGEKGERDKLRTLNATLQGAWAAAPIPGVTMIVAGHTHLFELLSFTQPLPPQVVVGNGGTDLAHKIKAALAGQSIGTATVARGDSVDDFGYALTKPAGGGKGWSLRLHDTKGKKVLECTIADGVTQCKDN